MNIAELTQILLFAYNNKLLPKWWMHWQFLHTVYIIATNYFLLRLSASGHKPQAFNESFYSNFSAPRHVAATEMWY